MSVLWLCLLLLCLSVVVVVVVVVDDDVLIMMMMTTMLPFSVLVFVYKRLSFCVSVFHCIHCLVWAASFTKSSLK